MFDWVIEEAFAEIPQWHPAVDRVILMPWRRIRKKPFSRIFFSEIKRFKSQLSERYDLIIDAQGLVKSAFMSLFAKGIRCGGDRRSAKEFLARLEKHLGVSVLLVGTGPGREAMVVRD